MIMILIGPIFFVCWFISVDARQEGNRQKQDPVEQIKQGNFSLKASQQPGPLMSFGQNMVDKNDTQLFVIVDDLQGQNRQLVTVIPTVLHGLRDDFSLYIQLPIVAKFQENYGSIMRGVQDLLVQLEWAFYDKTTVDTTNQISLVGNMTVPTGSSPELDFRVGPRLFGSYGTPTFFIGFTANYFTPEWYPFVSAGVKLMTPNDTIQYGHQYLYQWGLSKNICYRADRYIFNIMIEFDGTYRQKNMVRGVINQNSGGNQILFGPSLWYSTPHWNIQAGCSWYVYQQLYGVQNKDNYIVSVDVGYKF